MFRTNSLLELRPNSKFGLNNKTRNSRINSKFRSNNKKYNSRRNSKLNMKDLLELSIPREVNQVSIGILP
jgi:hypothetical protein